MSEVYKGMHLFATGEARIGDVLWEEAIVVPTGRRVEVTIFEDHPGYPSSILVAFSEVHEES